MAPGTNENCAQVDEDVMKPLHLRIHMFILFLLFFHYMLLVRLQPWLQLQHAAHQDAAACTQQTSLSASVL